MPDENQHEGLQMSFLEHLDELRKRLIQSAIAIAIAFSVCFYFSDKIFNFLAIPVKQQIRMALQEQRNAGTKDNRHLLKEGDRIQYTFNQDTLVDGLKVPAGTTVPVKVVKAADGKLTAHTVEPWYLGRSMVAADTELAAVLGEGEVAPGPEDEKLVITKVGGAFTLEMQVALYAAVAFAVPFLLYEIWAFIAPGLYRHEKRYVLPLILMGTVFFILGASFAYKIAFPAACNYLLGLQSEGGFRTLITADDYFDLIIMIMLGLGLVFQIPTISFLLGRIGLVTPRMLLKTWRYAIVIIMIIAAILTPTADAFNMLIFAAPMAGLYLLSIAIVYLFGKPRRTDEEVEALAHTPK
jgi:sec-independent protein translocase protein TatC